jgi:uncharacterized protein (UPF0262 family)
MDKDRELAQQIATVSSLSEDTAFRALQAGGRPRALAISILETQKEYAADNDKVAAAKQRLVELIPAQSAV